MYRMHSPRASVHIYKITRHIKIQLYAIQHISPAHAGVKRVKWVTRDDLYCGMLDDHMVFPGEQTFTQVRITAIILDLITFANTVILQIFQPHTKIRKGGHWK